jgi:tRNA (mo5U34)-methyltransferase
MAAMEPAANPANAVDANAANVADLRIPTKYVDHLSDEDLERLNQMLPWRCFTLDGRGRRFGAPASAIKRNVAQQIPDRRTPMLDARCPLAGLSVLEIGCFEGVHTIGLAARAGRVIAIDSRIENVVKTIVRTWSFGHHVTAFQCDVEKASDFAMVPEVDVVHHVGVLYHLVDPVAHLAALLQKTKRMLMLDTHIAADGQATESYVSGGKSYPYWRYREGGRADAFSGMYDHAKWLPLATLQEVLRAGGFADIEVAEMRQERNGLRALLFAQRAQ